MSLFPIFFSMKIHHSNDYVIATIGVDTAEKGCLKSTNMKHLIPTRHSIFTEQFCPCLSPPLLLLLLARLLGSAHDRKKKEERAEAAGVEIDLVGLFEIIPAHHMKLP